MKPPGKFWKLNTKLELEQQPKRTFKYSIFYVADFTLEPKAFPTMPMFICNIDI